MSVGILCVQYDVVVYDGSPHLKMKMNVIVFICGEVGITDEYNYNQLDKVHCRPRCHCIFYIILFDSTRGVP